MFMKGEGELSDWITTFWQFFFWFSMILFLKAINKEKKEEKFEGIENPSNKYFSPPQQSCDISFLHTFEKR